MGTDQRASGDSVLPPGLDSGDLVLFNRRCLSMSPYGALICGMSKLFSRSRWDHVGLIVRVDDGSLHLLEANMGGVKLRPLEERIKRSHAHEIAVRRLSMVRTEAFRKRLLEFAHRTLNIPYETNTGSLLSTVIDPVDKQERERLHALLLEKKTQLNEIDLELKEGALTAFQRRSLVAERTRVMGNVQALEEGYQDNERKDTVEGKNRFESRVCSELVAAVYQHVDYLTTYPLQEELVFPMKYLFEEMERMKSVNVYIASDSNVLPSPDSKLLIRDVLKHCRSGRSNIYQGQYGEAFYIVESGTLVDSSQRCGDAVLVSTIGSGTAFGLYEWRSKRLIKHPDDDKEVVVGTLRPGQSFGELSLMFDSPRGSTTRARTEVECWAISAENFQRLHLGSGANYLHRIL
eukprot:jgi/Galph1/1684/GphlegSOOS_G395.1